LLEDSLNPGHGTLLSTNHCLNGTDTLKGAATILFIRLKPGLYNQVIDIIAETFNLKNW